MVYAKLKKRAGIFNFFNSNKVSRHKNWIFMVFLKMLFLTKFV